MVLRTKLLAGQLEAETDPEDTMMKEKNAENEITGRVIISNMSLQLEREFVDQMKSKKSDNFIHHFIVIVTCHEQSSHIGVLNTKDHILDIGLKTTDILKFVNLKEDFVIKLEVFGLQSKQEVHIAAKH